MTDLVAAIEHHTRRFIAGLQRGLAETCSGFNDYEAGDYLETSAATPRVAETTPASYPPCSPGSTNSPAAVQPEPAAGLSWVDWATPAICDVLATHSPGEVPGAEDIFCNCITEHGNYRMFRDFEAWRQHVAPLIANRIEQAEKSRARTFMETGHDMGVSVASEFFPQYLKPQ